MTKEAQIKFLLRENRNLRKQLRLADKLIKHLRRYFEAYKYGVQAWDRLHHARKLHEKNSCKVNRISV